MGFRVLHEVLFLWFKLRSIRRSMSCVARDPGGGRAGFIGEVPYVCRMARVEVPTLDMNNSRCFLSKNVEKVSPLLSVCLLCLYPAKETEGGCDSVTAFLN